MVIVAVPDAPDTPSLPGVAAEAEALAARIPGTVQLRDPDRKQVLAALPHHTIAHLSCHGYANWADPTASQLILKDHQTSPLTVAHITAARLTGALIFLSACETTVTRQELADEAVHITGAFHLAGYQHVIGTLWPVEDTAATQLAIDFYTHLTNDGTTPPRVRHSAAALHDAIRAMRAQYPGEPALWASHIHVGP